MCNIYRIQVDGSGPSAIPYIDDVVTESLGRRRQSILVRQLQERGDSEEPVHRVAVGWKVHRDRKVFSGVATRELNKQI